MQERIFDNGVVLNGKSYSNKIVVEIGVSEFEDKPVFCAFKRMFDFFASFCALAVLLIPMGIIALVIRIDSRGPSIYKQERLGMNGKPFMLYKFRSMVEDAEADGARWAEKNDARVTRCGRFLRKTRLDELPQLINIIKGDMSIVGPRPEREIFYNEFDKYIEGFRTRLMVKPGLTGLAQVKGGYELLPEEKIIYDIEYIKKRSFIFDMKIIFTTVKVVFNHKGAR